MNRSLKWLLAPLLIGSQALLASWSEPKALSSEGWTTSPRVALTNSGDAYVIYTSSQDGEVFSTELYQNGKTITFPLTPGHTTCLPNLDLAIDRFGGAVAIWFEHFSESQTDQAMASHLTNGQWCNPINVSQDTIHSINQDTPPAICTDIHGRTTFLWTNYFAPNSTVRCNQLFEGVWLGRRQLAVLNCDVCSPVITGIPSGDIIGLWIDKKRGNVYYGCLSEGDFAYSQISGAKSQAITEIYKPVIISSAAGKVAMAWINQKGAIETASYLDGTISPIKKFAMPKQNNAQTVDITMDPMGNIILIWSQFDKSSNSYRLFTAREYTGIWGEPEMLVDAVPHPLRNAHITVNAAGKMMAVWQEKVTPDVSHVFVSLYYDNTFHEATRVSPEGAYADDPRFAINDRDDAIIAWNEGIGGHQSIQLIKTRRVFNNGDDSGDVEPPQQPKNFTGRQRVNQFASGVEFVNILTWTPSPDSSTVSYRIYRNGQLVITLPASGPYVFEERVNRYNRHVQYSLTAVNNEGVESAPLIVNLP